MVADQPARRTPTPKKLLTDRFLLIAQCNADPRIGETTATVLSYRMDGLSTAEIAATMGVSTKAVDYHTAKLRRFGIIQGSVRTSAIHPHADPVPGGEDGDHSACRVWLARVTSTNQLGLPRRFIRLGVSTEQKLLVEQAKLLSNPDETPKEPECLCQAVHRAAMQSRLASAAVPRVRTHARRESLQIQQQVNGGVGGDVVAPPAHAAVSASPMERPAGKGYPYVLSVTDVACLDTTRFNHRLLDTFTLRTLQRLRTMLKDDLQVKAAILAFTPAALNDMMDKAEGKASPAGYLACEIHRRHPDRDLYLQLAELAGNEWSVTYGRLEVRQRPATQATAVSGGAQ